MTFPPPQSGNQFPRTLQTRKGELFLLHKIISRKYPALKDEKPPGRDWLLVLVTDHSPQIIFTSWSLQQGAACQLIPTTTQPQDLATLIIRREWGVRWWYGVYMIRTLSVSTTSSQSLCLRLFCPRKTSGLWVTVMERCTLSTEHSENKVLCNCFKTVKHKNTAEASLETIMMRSVGCCRMLSVCWDDGPQ